MAKREYEFEFFVKKLKEDEEKQQGVVSAAEDKVRAEKETLEAIQIQLDAITREKKEEQAEYWNGMKSGRLTAGEIQTRKHYIESLEGSFREQRMKFLAQERAVQRAEKALAKEQEALNEITKKIDMHKDLEKEWLDGIREEERKKEQKRIDEVGSMLYDKKRREGSGS